MRDFPGALLVGGGLPIEVGGHFYGGVGVSGAAEKETPGMWTRNAPHGDSVR